MFVIRKRINKRSRLFRIFIKFEKKFEKIYSKLKTDLKGFNKIKKIFSEYLSTKDSMSFKAKSSKYFKNKPKIEILC